MTSFRHQSIITRSISLGVAKAGNLKLDFMAKSIGIHFFEFEDMFRCYRDNENLKKHFGRMDTLSVFPFYSHVLVSAFVLKAGFH